MVVDNVHHHITVEATPPLHTNYPDGIAAYCEPENKVSLGFVEGLNNSPLTLALEADGSQTARKNPRTSMWSKRNGTRSSGSQRSASRATSAFAAVS